MLLCPPKALHSILQAAWWQQLRESAALGIKRSPVVVHTSCSSTNSFRKTDCIGYIALFIEQILGKKQYCHYT
jgi:hypothetical protein